MFEAINLTPKVELPNTNPIKEQDYSSSIASQDNPHHPATGMS